MKKILMCILVLALVLPLSFVFVGCGRNNNNGGGAPTRTGPRNGFYTVSQKFQDLQNQLMEFAMEMMTGQMESIAEWASEEIEWMQGNMVHANLDYENAAEIRVFFLMNPWLERAYPGITAIAGDNTLTADQIWDAIEQLIIDQEIEMFEHMMEMMELMLGFTPEESILIFENDMFVMFEGFLPILAANLFTFSNEVSAWSTPSTGHIGIWIPSAQLNQYLDDLNNLFATEEVFYGGYIFPVVNYEYQSGEYYISIRLVDVNLSDFVYEYMGVYIRLNMRLVVNMFEEMLQYGLLMPTNWGFYSHVSHGTVGDSSRPFLPDLEQLESILNLIAIFDVFGAFVRLGFEYNNGRISLDLLENFDLEMIEEILGIDLSQLPIDIVGMLDAMNMNIADLLRVSYTNGLISFQLYIPNALVVILGAMPGVYTPSQLLDMAYEFTGINLSSLLTTTSNGGNLITFAQFERVA